MTNTVLFAGGEDTSFNTSTSNSYQAVTNSGYFRSNFARCAMQAVSAPETNVPPIQRLRSELFTTQVTLWAHAWGYAEFQSGNPANPCVTDGTVIGFMDSSYTYRLFIRTTGTYQQLQLCKINAAGTITVLATSGNNTYNTTIPLQALDVYINYGSSGTFTLYINGTQIVTYSGNIVTDSCTGIACVDWCQFGTSANNTTPWSEMLVQTSDTRGVSVFTVPPVANGNTNTWTGSVSNVNETTINDTNYNYTTSSSQLALYTMSTTLPTGNWTVEAFVQEVRISVGQSGPQNFDFVVRTTDGSNNLQTGPAPLNYFGNNAYIWATNPHTGVAWATTDFSTGFNYGIESVT